MYIRILSPLLSQSIIIHSLHQRWYSKNDHRFPSLENLSCFARKPRFDLHQNCLINSIFNKNTRTLMAIVDCEEMVWSANCRQVWVLPIREYAVLFMHQGRTTLKNITAEI